MENQLINIANNDGVLTVGSVEVARHFEKQHKHVLQTIHDLAAENSAVSFSHTRQKNNKKKAAEFSEAYTV